MKRFLSSTNGASTVEFVLVIPIAVLMILGTINLCLLVFQSVRMQTAAREAARCVTIGTCSNTNTSVNAHATAYWRGFGIKPTFTWSNAGCGNTVIATVDPYKLITGIGRLSLKLETKACYPLQS